MNLAVEFILLIAMLVGVFAVAQFVVISPLLGIALCVAPAMWVQPGGIDLALGEVAGFLVSASDLIVTALVVAALMRLGEFGGWKWVWAAIVALFGIALMQGIAIFGPEVAINEARTTIYLVGALSWALTVDWAKLDLFKASLVVGWLMVALAALNVFLHGFGSLEDVSGPKRMLNAAQALVLALCAGTLILGSQRHRHPRTPISVVVFMVVIIAAQNRSVWVAVIGGSIAVLVLSVDASRRKQAFGLLMLGGLGAVFVLTAALGDSITSKLTTAASDTGSFGWRTQSWRELLAAWLRNGPVEIATGQPWGSGFERTLQSGYVTTLASHSWYVELLLRSGVVGTLLWIALIVRGIARAREVNTAALFFGAAFLCFSVTYSLPWHVAPWLGVLLTLPAATRSSRGSTSLDASRSEASDTTKASTATRGTIISAYGRG